MGEVRCRGQSTLDATKLLKILNLAHSIEFKVRKNSHKGTKGEVFAL